jgi:hypothetical protein
VTDRVAGVIGRLGPGEDAALPALRGAMLRLFSVLGAFSPPRPLEDEDSVIVGSLVLALVLTLGELVNDNVNIGAFVDLNDVDEFATAAGGGNGTLACCFPRASASGPAALRFENNEALQDARSPIVP